MKVKFIKSPMGTHKLGYFAGDEAEFPDTQAQTLITDGVAIEVKETTTPAPPAPEETETAAMEHPAAETATAGPKKNGKK